jgi:signal transduction histidine kinase
MIGWLERGTGPFGPVAVAVLQASEPREALIGTLLQEFLATAVWLLAPIALACVAIAVFTLRNGLRPLREASEAATRVGPAHPGLRLPTARLTRELMPLVSAVNEALARLERGLEVQRRFSAEAAHALRTPLAVLMARLDALPESVAEGADLRGDVERMARLVSQTLLMARLEGLPLAAKQEVDLREVAVEALSGLAPLAVRLGIDLALKEGPSVKVAGNRASLVLALSNLLENALAHAPAGSEVAVEIAPISGGGRIAVLDRGPGVAPAEAEAIFDRFRRGVRPAKGGSGAGTGAGLGLAIVAEIVRQHGGSARAQAREGGGAVFILELPRESERKLAAG